MRQCDLCLYNCFCCCVNFDSVCISSLMPQLTMGGISFYNNKGWYNSMLVVIQLHHWSLCKPMLKSQSHRCPVAQANAPAFGVHPITAFSDSVLMMLQPVLSILWTTSALLHLLLEQKPQRPGYLLVMWKSQIQGPSKSSLKNWLHMAQLPLGVLRHQAMKLLISEKLEIWSQRI